MKRTIFAITLVAIGLIAVGVGHEAQQARAQAPAAADLAALYTQHIQAINRGDLAAVMADYAPDAVFVAPGGPQCAAAAPCQSKEAIQGLFQALIAAHLQAGIIDLQAAGSTLTGRLNMINDGIRAAGFGVVRIKVMVTYRGEKIARDVVEYELGDPATAAYLHFQNVRNLIRSLTDFRNRGEAAIAASFFTEDAEFRGGTCTPCIGKAGIQQLFERQYRAGNRQTLESVRVSGNSATFRQPVDFSPPQFGSISRVQVDITIQLRDGKISSWVAVNDLTDPQTAAYVANMAAQAQAAPGALVRKTLVSRRLEQLPQGPLCWRAAEHAMTPQLSVPASGFHQHPLQVAYEVEGTQELRFPDGPSVILPPGTATFIPAGRPHAHTSGGGPARDLFFIAGCVRPPSLDPGVRRVGITDALPGLRTEGVPYQLDFLEVSGQPGDALPAHVHPGPETTYLLQGAIDLTSPSGTTRYGTGDLLVIPAGTPHQAAVVGSDPAKALVIWMNPVGEAPVQPVPGGLPRTGSGGLKRD